MANPPYRFVVRYDNSSSELALKDIVGAFDYVDRVLEERLSGRPGLFMNTFKSLTTDEFLSNVTIDVYNTYDVTEMIRDRLLRQSSNITLIKDIII